MTKQALIIIPYFGILPEWFQLFIDSCRSELVDFLLITDDSTPYIFPANFIVFIKTFNHFKDDFMKKVGQNIYLEHPYKLCDYRPLFGKVFLNETKNYNYWGYSDIDLIFGDIDYFLEPYFKAGFEKLFRYGHFSLYKNDNVMRELYKEKIINYNFDFVKSTSIPCHFDEVSINTMIVSTQKELIQTEPFHNININYKNFAVGNGKPAHPQLISKKGRKLYLIELINDQIVEKEFFYIHFMRRKNLPVYKLVDKYVICVEGFIPFKTAAELRQLFTKYGLPVKNNIEDLYQKKLLKERRANKFKTFKREVEYFGLKGIYNIFYHYFLHKLWKY